jgi:hypothetical protein
MYNMGPGGSSYSNTGAGETLDGSRAGDGAPAAADAGAAGCRPLRRSSDAPAAADHLRRRRRGLLDGRRPRVPPRPDVAHRVRGRHSVTKVQGAGGARGRRARPGQRTATLLRWSHLRAAASASDRRSRGPGRGADQRVCDRPRPRRRRLRPVIGRVPPVRDRRRGRARARLAACVRGGRAVAC